MEKFPADVATSETLTGGDPNIIHDEEFAQKEKKSIWADIFQDTKKQNKNKSTPNKKGRPTISPTKVTPRTNTIISVSQLIFLLFSFSIILFTFYRKITR